MLFRSYHPQTDGQTERANRTLEEMLRAFVNERHDNWDELLCTAEFAYNNALHGSAKHTPFYLNYLRHPRTPDALVAAAPLPPSRSPDADAQVRELRQALDSAKAHLAHAKQVAREYADKSRKEHKFKAGDKVMVETKYLLAVQTGLSRKFDKAWAGPYTVAELV